MARELFLSFQNGGRKIIHGEGRLRIFKTRGVLEGGLRGAKPPLLKL